MMQREFFLTLCLFIQMSNSRCNIYLDLIKNRRVYIFVLMSFIVDHTLVKWNTSFKLKIKKKLFHVQY